MSGIRDDFQLLRSNREALSQMWLDAQSDSERDRIRNDNNNLDAWEIELETRLENIPTETMLTVADTKARNEIAYGTEFSFLKSIYRAMDSFFLDPILGFFIPGAGDIITATLTVPFIFTSLLKIRSIPLTLAILSNTLIDMLIGMVPVVGDIIDVFNKSYKQNYKLIVGYVEGDPDVLQQIQKGAIGSAILITILCILIRLLALAIAALSAWVKGWFS